MKNTPRLYVLFLFLVAVSEVTGASAEPSLSQQLTLCSALGNDQARLACYDGLARNASRNTDQFNRIDRIQPPAKFLDSRLVAEPWKAEYNLTVRGFVDLISQAVMDNKKRVTVQGWSRDKLDYVLNITMRTPVMLHFSLREPAMGNVQMSLLRDVTMEGYTISAEEFIFIIAAMVPNKNTGDANSRRAPDSR